MPATIATATNSDYPASILPVDDNALLIADGVSSMMAWNGTSANALAAGVIAPTTALTLVDGGAGAITTTNAVAYFRYIKEGGYVSNFSPVSNALTIAAREIDYTGIVPATETGIIRIHIYRTLSGGGATVYLDVSVGPTATVATSNNADGVISLNQAVVLLDDEGNNIGDVNGIPPDDKAVLVNHLGRIFASVEVNHTRGHVEVTNGSATVVGVGTYWTSQMVGRYFYPLGSTTPYSIATVNAMTNGVQTLTLGTVYAGSTANFVRYAIRPDPVRRRTFQFSEAFLPQSWQEVNAISLPETSDDLRALISQNGYLYLVERSHTHRLTYQNDPASDGTVRLLTKRGCVNARSWVLVGEFIYLLDEQGIYRYDGGIGTESVSAPIQDMFRSGDGGAGFKINWRASKWFHAIHYPAQETIRWFVALSGLRYPRHGLCYNHQNGRWWVEEYRQPVCSSATARISLLRALTGSEHGKVFGIEVGSLDQVDPELWPRRMATAATLTTLSDSSAVFTADIAGAPITIVDGTGKGQVRDILRIDSATKVTLRTPWLVLPDATSVYQVGGMPWEWLGGVSRWANGSREMEAIFEPTTGAASLDLETYTDFSRTPDRFTREVKKEGVRIERNSSKIRVDLQTAIGKCRQGIQESRQSEAAGNEFVQVKASGVSAADQVRVLEIDIYGTE